MSLTFSLLKPPLTAPKPTHPTLLTTFLNGSPTLRATFSNLTLTTPTPTPTPTPTLPLTIKAMKSLQGRVVCATNDKTVSVEVTRLAPHPKYKRRVRKKKKFQAHDPDNIFKVGDLVQLQKCRPISKTKTFLAVPPLARKNSAVAVDTSSADIDIPLQSELTE